MLPGVMVSAAWLVLAVLFGLTAISPCGWAKKTSPIASVVRPYGCEYGRLAGTDKNGLVAPGVKKFSGPRRRLGDDQAREAQVVDRVGPMRSERPPASTTICSPAGHRESVTRGMYAVAVAISGYGMVAMLPGVKLSAAWLVLAVLPGFTASSPFGCA